MVNRPIVFQIILSLFIFTNCVEKPMQFEIFELLEKRDVEGLGHPVENHKWYLVENYKDTPTNHAIIDSFVCTIYNNYFTNLTGTDDDFSVSFFKKTRKTNSAYLREKPRDFYRHSGIKDYICAYNFYSGDLVYISYYKNGIVEKTFSNFKCN
jgi:hypothetical protein